MLPFLSSQLGGSETLVSGTCSGSNRFKTELSGSYFWVTQWSFFAFEKVSCSPGWPPTVAILVTFQVAVVKYCDKSNLRGEGLSWRSV